MSKNTAVNTLNMLELFGIDTNINKDLVILHIPHSSLFIPDYSGYNLTSQFNVDMNALTDTAIDEIFNIKNTTKLIANFSRMFCDVERLPNDIEPMYQYGYGYFYTKYSNGDTLRTENKELTDTVFNDYYLKHHNKLNVLTNLKLGTYGKAIIIDCHSFNDIPMPFDLNKNVPRPDICLGTDEFHTPKYLVEIVKNYFTEQGFSVEINNPYVGTIIPSEYQMNPNVQGIMIEINKRLYMNGNEVDSNKVKFLNEFINDLFNS